jgi:hypothetical protein
MGEMALKCPKCGAENADYLFYCGSCASGLRDVPTRSVEVRQPAATARDGFDSAAEHKAKLKKSLRQLALASGALAAIWLLLGVLSMTDGELDYSRLFYLFLAGLFALNSVYSYWTSTNDEALSFFRLGGWTGNVSVEVAGLNLSGLVGVLVGITAGVMTGILFVDEPGFIIYSAVFILVMIGSLFLVMFCWPPKVALEEAGICIGYHSRNRVFIPFEKVSSVGLKKKVLRVSLSKRRPLSFKTHRYLLLGNIEDMRKELDRVAPSGVPSRALTSPYQKGAEVAGPEVVFEGTGPSKLTPAGIMLIIAGFFAFMNAVVLFAIDSLLFTPGSSPLVCCGGLEVLCGAIAILGGILTIRRVKYKLSVIASILAIVSGGGLIVSPALGIISLVIIHRYREDFVD